MIRKKRERFVRPVAEVSIPTPGLEECSEPTYSAFRVELTSAIAGGATPREIAERIAEALDRFPGVVSLRGEMHDYAEMGDRWLPLDRRDLWDHFRSLPRETYTLRLGPVLQAQVHVPCAEEAPPMVDEVDPDLSLTKLDQDLAGWELEA